MTKLLYSFPWSIGVSGIGYTAWEHVNELSKLDIDIDLIVGCQARDFNRPLRFVKNTQSFFNKKIPTKLFGGIYSAANFHDVLVAKYIKNNHEKIDVLHCWPLASYRSIKMAKKFGITTFLERPNTHTEYAYKINAELCEQENFIPKTNASHTYNKKRLDKEILEYDEADFILCPSDFVLKTFLDKGFNKKKLLCHQYGYSPQRIETFAEKKQNPFTVVFVGNDVLRKGLSNVLKAWSISDASETGELHIFGEIDKDYLTKIEKFLRTSSVRFHGFSTNIRKAYKDASCFLLSSFEEGSALVTYEARAAGCVLLVSQATGAVLEHKVTGLIHQAGDVNELARHINLIYHDPILFKKLQENSLSELNELTWEYSAKKLHELYKNNNIYNQ